MDTPHLTAPLTPTTLRALMAEHHISQAKLAARIGVTPRAVALWVSPSGKISLCASLAIRYVLESRK